MIPASLHAAGTFLLYPISTSICRSFGTIGSVPFCLSVSLFDYRKRSWIARPGCLVEWDAVHHFQSLHIHREHERGNTKTRVTDSVDFLAVLSEIEVTSI